MRTTRFPGADHVPLALGAAEARALFEDAVSRFGGECQVLDCYVSMARQPSDETPGEVLSTVLSDPGALLTMVLREGHGRDHWELCASDLREPSRFLYVRCSPEEGRALAAAHGLTVVPRGADDRRPAAAAP